MTDYGEATEAAISRVVTACERYGSDSIIGLAGVPGTGKSYIAAIAAQRYTGEPLLVRSVQFHRSYTYEEFIEGMRLDQGGAVEVVSGVFLDWNQRALLDPDNRYVLLIDELTRADMSTVLGELMTYLEHRERPFFTMYGRRDVFIAPNLVVLATYNPTDRSALDLDNALIRRMRILPFQPDMGQLKEMLVGDLIESGMPCSPVRHVRSVPNGPSRHLRESHAFRPRHLQSGNTGDPGLESALGGAPSLLAPTAFPGSSSLQTDHRAGLPLAGP